VRGVVAAPWRWECGDAVSRWARSLVDALDAPVAELRVRDGAQWERTWVESTARDLAAHAELDRELVRVAGGERSSEVQRCYATGGALGSLEWAAGSDLAVGQLPEVLGERRSGEPVDAWLGREWEVHCRELVGAQWGRWEATRLALVEMGRGEHVELDLGVVRQAGSEMVTLWPPSNDGRWRVPLLAAVALQRREAVPGVWRQWARPLTAQAELALRLGDVPVDAMVALVEASLAR